MEEESKQPGLFEWSKTKKLEDSYIQTLLSKLDAREFYKKHVDPKVEEAFKQGEDVEQT